MYLKFFLSAILTGFIVAIPPGSVTIVACRKTLHSGLKDALLFTLGSSISDIFYIVLVYLGVAEVLSQSPVYRIMLWIVCGVLLIYIGTDGLLSMRKLNSETCGELKEPKARRSIIEGILVTLTNPLTIIGWIAVAGNFFLLWSSRINMNIYLFPVTVFFIMFGCLAYFISMLVIVNRLKRFLKLSVQKGLVIFSSILLNMLGIAAFYSAIKEFN